VQYATQSGTATSPNDYYASCGTIVFAPGQTSKKIRVTIVNDKTAESLESATVILSHPHNAQLDTANTVATFVIYDDDGTVPTIQFSAPNYVVSESGGSATITVQLSAAASYPVVVNYATSDWTGTAPDDYSATSGTLTFQPGDTSKTFPVAIMNNSQPND